MTDSHSTTPATHAEEHARAVSGMFGRIASWYDFLNHALSLGQDIYWRSRLVRLVRTGSTGRILDLAAGTLDVSTELIRQHPDQHVLAMDFSLPMLQKGKSKIEHKGSAHQISPALADGRSIPLPDSCVDSVTIAFGIRNIIPREDAFREINRVLAPGGRICILEFGSGKRKILSGVYNFYLKTVLPFIGKIISGDKGAYGYLADTIMAFPPADELGRELEDCGFETVFYQPMLQGIVYLHVGTKPA